MAVVLCLSGRKKEHPVWDYFKYNIVENVSICQIHAKAKQPTYDLECEDITVCGESITGANSTNLVSHLSTHKVSAEYKEFLVKVEKWKKIKDKKVASMMNVVKKLENIENFFTKNHYRFINLTAQSTNDYMVP